MYNYNVGAHGGFARIIAIDGRQPAELDRSEERSRDFEEKRKLQGCDHFTSARCSVPTRLTCLSFAGRARKPAFRATWSLEGLHNSTKVCFEGSVCLSQSFVSIDFRSSTAYMLGAAGLGWWWGAAADKRKTIQKVSGHLSKGPRAR